MVKTTAESRPFWLTKPCPPWCDTEHDNLDAPCDRKHYPAVDGDADHPIEMTLMPGRKEGGPLLHVELEQEVREAEPRITVASEGLRFGFELTLVETRRLVEQLTRMLRIAEG